MNKKLNLLIIFILLVSIFLYASKQNSITLDLQSKENVNQDTIQSMDRLLHQGIADSSYPGYVFLGAKDGKVIYFESGGHFTYDSKSTAMEKSTIFDMASVTKVIATTSAIMLLYDDGKIDLDAKVIDYLPEFGANGKDKITLRDLLTHSSGLPAWSKLWQDTKNSAGVVNNLFNLELAYPTGEQTVYSCMGFITLGKVVEKITGKSMDEFLEARLFQPLNMTHTFFNPKEKYFNEIAPTEYDSSRGGILHGRVHDENAYYVGGVSGNAGLFSRAEDLAIFCQMMLNKGIYNGKRIFKPETVELFTKRQNIVEGSSRCLGWDTPSGHASSGHYFSSTSYGHTGFTGTAIWIDPEKQLFGIFLTNRVYPTRTNRKLYKMRFKVYDLLQESILDFPLIKNPNVEQN